MNNKQRDEITQSKSKVISIIFLVTVIVLLLLGEWAGIYNVYRGTIIQATLKDCIENDEDNHTLVYEFKYNEKEYGFNVDTNYKYSYYPEEVVVLISDVNNYTYLNVNQISNKFNHCNNWTKIEPVILYTE